MSPAASLTFGTADDNINKHQRLQFYWIDDVNPYISQKADEPPPCGKLVLVVIAKFDVTIESLLLMHRYHHVILV